MLVHMEAGRQSSVSWIKIAARFACAWLLTIGFSVATQTAAIAATTPLSNAISVSVGGIALARHACAVLSDTTVRCWGSNGTGQLGTGSYNNSSIAVAVSGLSGVVQVVTGSAHTCALMSSGTVKCWGDNTYNQLGTSSISQSSVPIDIANLSGVTAIATRGYSTCALSGSGTVLCWGAGWGGQLGNANVANQSTPVSVNGVSSATAIAVGDSHACALLASGSAQCWGSNSTGQLGNGNTTDSNTPVTVSGLSNAVKLAAGGMHTCAVLSDGTAKCWGWNASGQLGTGNNADTSTPTAVSGLAGAASIATGGTHTCALLTTGQSVCWGSNSIGELGNGDTFDHSSPVAVKGLAGTALLAAGDNFTCALLNTGTVSCWGSDSWGQLGNNVFGYSDIPLDMAASAGLSGISAGDDHNCALSADGQVACWGASNAGELGNASTLDSGIPAFVANLPTASAVSSGSAHTCALTTAGTIYCWGDNSFGQLGSTSPGRSTVPLLVKAIPAVTAVASGVSHTCALTTAGNVYCWGANYYGQLGNGSLANSATPSAVQGLTGVTAIASNSDHTCALTNTGAVSCWGYNGSGELGNGTTTNSTVPTTVSGVANAVAISSGGYNSCAVLGDHTVACWGSNNSGQLGYNGTYSSVPVSIPGLTNVSSVEIGGYFACAIAGSRAYCWGGNSFGQIGNGNVDNGHIAQNVYTPTLVNGLPDISELTTGYDYACAKQIAGTVSCWGNNSVGQLGTGLLGYFTTPQMVLVDCPACLPSGFVPLTPARLMDTRPAPFTTTDGQFLGGGSVGEGGSINLTVLGRGGVPADGVSAVVLNVTVVAPTGDGYVTVWPAGNALPLAANLNFIPGKTVANLVVSKVGTDGQVTLYNSSGQTDLVVDVAGYFTSTSDLTAMVPFRLLDTRQMPTIDGNFSGIGALEPGGILDLTIAGRAGIPETGVSAVALNVTVTEPTAEGFITAWPSGVPMPGTANLNFVKGDTVPNLVLSKVGSNGKISLFNSNGSTHLVADAVGYFKTSDEFAALVPARLLDTRWGYPTIDGQFTGTGAQAGDTTLNLSVWGRGGVPAVGVGAVALNVTVTNPTMPGHITVWPTGLVRPVAANINFAPGKTVPNLVIAKVGINGQVSIYNSSGMTDIVADVVGWFPDSP